MRPLAITAFTLTTALGAGKAATLEGMRTRRCGLAPLRFLDLPLATWTGEVDDVDQHTLPASLKEFDCRNNRLAWLALGEDAFAGSVERARQRWGSERVGVFLGTSTSGLLETELGYRHRQPDGSLPADFCYAGTQNTFSLAAFAARALQLAGPRYVVSTACSSSAKVFATAQRMLEANWIDAALVGGVDSLCLTTLYGFNALELLSPEVCRPWDLARRGLSIGEGASFMLIERSTDSPEGWVLGVGETSDGYHMSTPQPEGVGAVAAMRGALAAAKLQPRDIDYVNLHGTATPTNDASEDRALGEVFGATTPPCSSTKGATGHTLGAAGGIEAAICLLALQHDLMPGGLGRNEPDATLHATYIDSNRDTPVRHVVSNSFGFGGTNVSLVLGKEER